MSTTPESGTRIRWEPNDDGRDYTAAFRGYAGQSDAAIFAIYPPCARVSEWALRSDLTGQDHYRAGGDKPDNLKPHAERWLEEFVSSLDASFGPDARWSALGDWLYAQVQDANMAERAAFADGLTDAEVRHSTRGAAWRAALEKMHELESGEKRSEEGESQ